MSSAPGDGGASQARALRSPRATAALCSPGAGSAGRSGRVSLLGLGVGWGDSVEGEVPWVSWFCFCFSSPFVVLQGPYSWEKKKRGVFTF